MVHGRIHFFLKNKFQVVKTSQHACVPVQTWPVALVNTELGAMVSSLISLPTS